jgi:4-hydroxythreonine-4-phosphate dehydrogenase
MGKAVALLGSKLKINVCTTVKDADFSPSVLNVVDLANLPEAIFAKGQVDPVAGKAAIEYISRAVEMALAGEIDAISSAPINKEAMHLAGYDFAGVTELLAYLTNSKEYAMVLVLGPIRLFYVANHVSMREALESVTKETVLSKIRQVNKALGDFGITGGKIAVAALNPHGGEGGAMGTEEAKEIIPAIEAAKSEGIDALGPFPADTIFIRGRKGDFDAILVMYHDQGNIAAKLLGFGSGVTVVTGLPIIRTSVAHGTAFDIAGTGTASPETLIAAIRTAGEIAKKNSV